MQPRLKVSRAATALIKPFEGFRPEAARAPDGGWSIGYGHAQTAREGATVSEPDAELLLIHDLMQIAETVNDLVFTPVNQHQFDALCAFAFGVGMENFRRSSALRLLNEGKLLEAAQAIELWRKTDFQGERIVFDALVRRRAAEKALFLTPMAGFVPAPKAILPPYADPDEALVEGRAAVDPEALSPTEQAARSISARLQALFPDPPPPPAEDVAPFETETVVESAPEPQPEPDPEPEPVAAAGVPEPESPRLVVSPSRSAGQPRGLWRVAPLALLAALGLAMFAWGLFWLFESRTGGVAGPDQGVVGWVAGVAGVAFFGVAAYLLLDRLGAAEDDVESEYDADRGRDITP